MEADRRKTRSDLANAAKALARNPEDPDAVARVEHLRCEYRTVALAEHIRAVVDATPPLSGKQRAWLAALLLPADHPWRGES